MSESNPCYSDLRLTNWFPSVGAPAGGYDMEDGTDTHPRSDNSTVSALSAASENVHRLQPSNLSCLNYILRRVTLFFFVEFFIPLFYFHYVLFAFGLCHKVQLPSKTSNKRGMGDRSRFLPEELFPLPSPRIFSFFFLPHPLFFVSTLFFAVCRGGAGQPSRGPSPFSTKVRGSPGTLAHKPSSFSLLILTGLFILCYFWICKSIFSPATRVLAETIMIALSFILYFFIRPASPLS